MRAGTDDHVELDRDFVPLRADRPYRLDELDLAGLFGGRGLKWRDLLERDRVVILAGAEGGKTREFRERGRVLRERGRFARYVTIERPATDGLDAALNLKERRDFEAWRSGDETGWFFLDSVDEARINRCHVDTALNRFAQDLGAGYDRARILLSCRGSVWEGDPIHRTHVRRDQRRERRAAGSRA